MVAPSEWDTAPTTPPTILASMFVAIAGAKVDDDDDGGIDGVTPLRLRQAVPSGGRLGWGIMAEHTESVSRSS